MTGDHETRDFDPSQPGVSDTLWGLPFGVDEAALVILPVPWEVTVSYGAGTADAPSAILAASTQVDLYDADHPETWKRGIALASLPSDLRRLNDETRPKALSVVEAIAAGDEPASHLVSEVNRACDEMVARVHADAKRWLSRGKMVAVLGGDHSVPLGLMRALGERFGSDELGILHIDAHCDLRDAYEGFVHSHASIMRNALRVDGISKLVQVGIRDYCEEELHVIRASAGRVKLYDDRSLARRRFEGESWSSVAEDIVRELPPKVYVSFDVDGLDPALCPGTGTPVPGGLAYEEALYLVERLVATDRAVVGFDLSEVSPSGERGSEWDANVGARLLYRLSCAALASKGSSGPSGPPAERNRVAPKRGA